MGASGDEEGGTDGGPGKATWAPAGMRRWAMVVVWRWMIETGDGRWRLGKKEK